MKSPDFCVVLLASCIPASAQLFSVSNFYEPIAEIASLTGTLNVNGPAQTLAFDGLATIRAGTKSTTSTGMVVQELPHAYPEPVRFVFHPSELSVTYSWAAGTVPIQAGPATVHEAGLNFYTASPAGPPAYWTIHYDWTLTEDHVVVNSGRGSYDAIAYANWMYVDVTDYPNSVKGGYNTGWFFSPPTRRILDMTTPLGAHLDAETVLLQSVPEVPSAMAVAIALATVSAAATVARRNKVARRDDAVANPIS